MIIQSCHANHLYHLSELNYFSYYLHEAGL